MACSSSVALAVFLLVSGVSWGSATVYTVGDSTGWTTNYDYSTWTSGKTFTVGDSLVFNFATGAHTVTEVGSSDYSACSGANALSTTSTGPTTVTLKSSGTHYYICTISGHCAGGMKLAVTVTAASSSPPSPPSSPSSPTAPSASPTPPSSTTTPVTPSAAADLMPARGLVAAGLTGLMSLVLGFF